MRLPQNPIFIVGYPRSGTTLLQRLLVTQPGLYTFPETHYFNVIEKKIQWGEDKETIPPAALPNVFENIYEKMGIRYTAVEVETLNRQAENKQLSSKALFEYIVTRYLSNLYPGIEDIPSWRWIEKTPNHAHFQERILGMYPQVRFLHILRHPVPAIYSRKLKFPFNRETPVVVLARRWNRMLDDVQRFKSQNPNHILTLRYEDLVTQMEEEMKRVGAFLEIDIDIQRYSGMNRENPGLPEGIILPSEPWKLEDLRREFTNTNQDYKTIFSPRDAEAIEEVIGERLEKCGYEPFYGRDTGTPGLTRPGMERTIYGAQDTPAAQQAAKKPEGVMKEYDPGKPLISLHIPKCAGQSFRAILEQWFGTRFYLHYFQKYNARPPKHELKPGICIHGHFNRTRGFGVMDYYPEVHQFVTILRDPLEAAISNYFFWKTKARANQLKKGIIKPGDENDYRDIDDFFEKRPKSNMLDFMPCELTLANYREILETKFVWIGIVENLPAAVEVLARRLGYAPIPLERINTSLRDEELSHALRQVFTRDNALEFEIYRYVKEWLK